MEDNYEYQVTKEEKNLRLDVFVNIKLEELTRSQIKNLIENNNITVNNTKVKSGYSLKENDIISVHIPEIQTDDILPEDIKLDIVYEDEYLAVINKPQNMTVHPAGSIRSGTLVNALMFHFKNLSRVNGEVRPGIVHRLDKDTSGLIVIAKNDKVHLELQKQIQDKTCHRIYRAVAYGKFNKEEGRIENYLARGKSKYEKIFVVPPLQGRLAITEYKVLDYNCGFSYVEFNLKTGRTHQIRVHSSHLGHPIVGDKLYGKPNEKFNLLGQLLHAYQLEFIHPITKKQMLFTASLPDYFINFLNAHNLKN